MRRVLFATRVPPPAGHLRVGEAPSPPHGPPAPAAAARRGGATWAGPAALTDLAGGLKPHACSHCEATFAEAGHLKQHLSAVYLGLKPYACSHREATFCFGGRPQRHLS